MLFKERRKAVFIFRHDSVKACLWADANRVHTGKIFIFDYTHTKMKYYLTLLLAILSIVSCKKSDHLAIPIEEVDTLETNGFKFDYLSLVIDGKTYVCKDNGGSYRWGSGPANRKVASIDAGGIHLDKGNPDSVMFFREYFISNDSTFSVDAIFCKKYAKKDMTQQFFVWHPENQLDLFRPGLQGFATDWERENSYDGVSLKVIFKEGGKYTTYSTHSQQYPNFPTGITNDSQKGSRFDIVKLAYTKRGDYIEAKFKTKIFNLKEESKVIEKGFMRLHVGYFSKQ